LHFCKTPFKFKIVFLAEMQHSEPREQNQNFAWTPLKYMRI
jgi:hypothetical protein